MTEATAGFKRLVDVLHRLEIPYFVCGSAASSVYGRPRGTMDIDLVAALRPDHIVPLVAGLSRDFYADQGMMEEALRAGRSFNLIHYASSYKFDIFPMSSDPYSQAQFERCTTQQVFLGGETLAVPVASAEDTVLSKLAWYRGGGEISDVQWNDIRGIVEFQGHRLDRAYMGKWAAHLGVEDLLERALSLA